MRPEIHRVLRPGGLLAYTVRNTADSHYRAGIDRGDDRYEVGGLVVHFFDRSLVERLAAGFELLCETVPCSSIPAMPRSVRQPGSSPGSVQVPLSVLFWRLDPASAWHDPGLSDSARQVVLICAHGYSSSLAAATLDDLGFITTCTSAAAKAWLGLPPKPPSVRVLPTTLSSPRYG